MLKLELVEERKTVLNHFTHGKILGLMFLFLCVPTFFVLPFLKGSGYTYWIFPYVITVCGFALVSFAIYRVKFFFHHDYLSIGFVELHENQLEIHQTEEIERIDLEKVQLELLFNALRGEGFHFASRDNLHSGISEIVINGSQSYKVLLRTEKELQQLKVLLHRWYEKKYAVAEYTRNSEKYRLIELEYDFDWKRLQEIKSK